MAAATKDRNTELKVDLGLKSYPVKASTKIYKGTLVAIDSAGYAIPAADAASNRVVGVADAQADNSSGANGDINLKVRTGVAKFTASSITQAMVGQIMYVVDDQTFDEALGTNGVKAGRLLEFISATEGWLLVQPTGVGAVLANADATYSANEQNLINELKTVVNTYVL